MSNDISCKYPVDTLRRKLVFRWDSQAYKEQSVLTPLAFFYFQPSELTGIADQDVYVIDALLDLVRGSFHVLDIGQIAGYELHTSVIRTERYTLAMPPFFAGSVEFALGSGQDKHFRYAMKKELCGNL